MRKLATGLTLALLLTAIFAVRTTAAAQTDDKSFVYMTLQQAKGQIRFAQLAQERAQTDAVRNLAVRAQHEWTAVQASLGHVAFQDAFPTPGALTDADLATLDRLGRTQPTYFDGVYLDVVTAGYRSAIDRMKEQSSTSDSGLQSFLNRTLPLFTDTLALAQRGGG